jgi:hypothetical protein
LTVDSFACFLSIFDRKFGGKKEYSHNPLKLPKPPNPANDSPGIAIVPSLHLKQITTNKTTTLQLQQLIALSESENQMGKL